MIPHGGKSMMWRTTFAFGAASFAALLAYMAFLLGSNAEHRLGLRVTAASVLTALALACAAKALREVRGERKGR